MIVDAHAHAFPSAEMGHDWQRLVGHAAPRFSGEIGELAERMAAGGIERCVILLYARSGEVEARLVAEGRMTAAEIRARLQQDIRDLNRWGCEVARRDPRFLPFAGVNPRYLSAAELVEEIDAVVALGAKGVKIIPPSMGLYANDPLLWPVYQRCSELGLPLLSQSGTGGGPPPHPGADHYGRPRHWHDVLGDFPELTVILAHLGLGYEEDLVELTRTHERLYTDTSLRLSGLDRPGRQTSAELCALIRRIGADRVLFGTNYPFVDPAAYRERLERLPLEPSERGLVAGENFGRILPVPEEVS